MSDAKHTPGPWRVTGTTAPDDHVRVESNLGDWHVVAELWRPHIGDIGANAKLIAAAPKIADALELIVKRHDADADADNPLGPGETGRMRCGCWACETAETALRAAGRLP